MKIAGFGALESLYRAKLCGTLSLFWKLMVTLAPAGTVMVPMLNAMFCAVRSIVTGCPPVEVVEEVLVLVEVAVVVWEVVVDDVLVDFELHPAMSSVATISATINMARIPLLDFSFINFSPFSNIFRCVINLFGILEFIHLFFSVEHRRYKSYKKGTEKITDM